MTYPTRTPTCIALESYGRYAYSIAIGDRDIIDENGLAAIKDLRAAAADMVAFPDRADALRRMAAAIEDQLSPAGRRREAATMLDRIVPRPSPSP